MNRLLQVLVFLCWYCFTIAIFILYPSHPSLASCMY
jgi:hypothetical protein